MSNLIFIQRISCLKLLINNQADFMTVEPEDLRIIGMTDDYNDKILVTHELRVWINESSNYQMVTVIRKTVHDVWHIAKKRFCTSGLESSLFALDYLKYFENQLVIPRCNSSKSLLENRLTALSEFFESACISGRWTSDQQYDNQLKRKYSNLSSQCGSFFQYYGDEGVLMCLTDGGGEIAWSRLDYVHRHFKEFRDDANEYYFLCLDGSLKNLTDPNPCVWFEVPWRTLIARDDIAEEVKNLIEYQLNGVDDSLSVLQEDIRREPIMANSSKTPKEYLKKLFPEFYAIKDYVQCRNNRLVKWCVVTNLEIEKCEWISKIGKNYGIEPFIKCVHKINRENCIKSVIDKQFDIFSVKPHEEQEAREKGLKPIVHMISSEEKYENKIVSLVKTFSNFHSLRDLKNHKACFINFRDVGWNTFIFMMKNLTGDNNWYCRDKEMVSEYFHEVSISDLNIKNNNSSFPKNFVSYISYKNTDKAALNCLNFENGDVAFVNLSSVLYYFPGSLENIYRPLCDNEINSDSGKVEKCYLSWRSEGSMMVHGEISKTKESKIYRMLVDLDKLLKGNVGNLSPLLSLYGPFYGQKNVIFSERTQYLVKEVGSFQRIFSYQEILEDLVTQKQQCNRANTLKQKSYLIIFACIIYSFHQL
ncbi:transferrin isoform X2 [Leptopilina heterotoma]|uniref:transferrin isoform X2 n=1 Tax=Leptopilina heterotoma TaxID=63436 RepID=UPI001CA98D18|nr:transferrin isoform X2 [Leptopilina heterotoma]